MLTVCSSHISLHRALHNFPIDMREQCESPGNKCAPLPLAGNWGNVSVQDVFDGSLLSYSDEKHCVTLFV